jgi:carbonic anhydrase
MHSFPSFLLEGYSSFMSGRYARETERYRELAQSGQNPSTMIIACCDSRAAPETIFDCGPGELFVLRNVANLVPPYQPDAGQHGTSAAIEFAVRSLGISNIVVMGHGRCGGIRAALDPAADPLDAGDFIGKWMSLLAPVSEQVNKNSWMTAGERQTALERISIRNSIRNLRSFPYIKSLEAEGKLRLHGAWFDISTGELWVMNRQTGDFERPETD